MKKILALCSFVMILLFTAACGNDNGTTDNNNDANNGTNTTDDNNNTVNNQTDNANNNAATNQNNTNTDNLPFMSFDLEVDYANNKSFDVDYDNERNDREAKIEDELNNQLLSGEEAFQELNNRFQTFSFDKNTSDDEVIKEVTKSFELDENYRKFDLDIKFSDGTEKEYIRTK